MTAPWWASDDGDVTLWLGDCLAVLPGLPDSSVDAIVTDPPYGLEFMGREWDGADGFRRSLNDADAGRDSVFGRTSRTSPEYRTGKPSNARIRERVDGRTNPAEGKSVTVTPEAYIAGQPFQRWCQAWAVECLRVLKPGGWLLAFGGTRTSHRLVCGIEDAGFEIRDAVADLTGIDGPGLLWLYGSGFPKSLDVSKAIDKRPGVARHAEFATHLAAMRETAGLSRADVSERVVGTRTGACWNWEHHQWPEARWWPALRDLLDLDGKWEAVIAEAERIKTGTQAGSRLAVAPGQGADRSVVELDITIPATDDAARWEGWGTALKPAWEPIVVARKPLAGTVAANVLEHGTGALNVDGCRVAAGQDYADKCASVVGLDSNRNGDAYGEWTGTREDSAHDAGRWPPNVVLGETAATELDRQSGATVSSSRSRHNTAEAHNRTSSMGRSAADWTTGGHDDSGGASRFFPVFRYEAKAAAHERPRLPDGTAHPTVKPVDLIAWLVRLVTPPGGVVLDPFAGSGTTAQACIVEGHRAVLIEQDPQSAELIKTRLSKPIQPTLFGGAA